MDDGCVENWYLFSSPSAGVGRIFLMVADAATLGSSEGFLKCGGSQGRSFSLIGKEPLKKKSVVLVPVVKSV